MLQEQLYSDILASKPILLLLLYSCSKVYNCQPSFLELDKTWPHFTSPKVHTDATVKAGGNSRGHKSIFEILPTGIVAAPSLEVLKARKGLRAV